MSLNTGMSLDTGMSLNTDTSTITMKAEILTPENRPCLGPGYFARYLPVAEAADQMSLPQPQYAATRSFDT